MTRTIPILAILAALILVMMVVALPKNGIVLTDHAINKGKIGLGMSVSDITARIQQGRCSPITVYVCRDAMKYICPLQAGMVGPDDLYMGIILGHSDGYPAVITGRIAPRKTWDRIAIRDGCAQGQMYIPIP